MTRPTRRLLIVLVAAFVAGLSTGLAARHDRQAQAPVFRAGTSAVSVDVSVRDGTKVVTGLTAKDFRLSDNGVEQTISDVSYGTLPIDVTVALDLSYSVNGSMLTNLRRAILQLMSDLGRDDRLKLITFNMQTTRVVDFTNDAKAVERAIDSATAGGGTAIFDAVSIALVSAAPPDRRQLVVVFTDGGDNMSITDPSTLLEVAERANTSLTVVAPGLMPAVGPFGRATAVSPVLRSRTTLFSQVTAATNGQLIPASGDLTAVFRRALNGFRENYVLHYIPAGAVKGFHTLRVLVPNKKSYTVVARRGYFVD